MPEKLILLRLDDREVSIRIGRSVHRDELYGQQRKSVEKNGEPLRRVVLDPEGRVFLPSDLAHLPTDTDGSLTSDPLFQNEDGESLELKLSSFKEPRPLQVAALDSLAALRVDTVFPVECGLPPGVYTTEFTYHDSPLLRTAVLIVRVDDAFLLTGTQLDSPLQGRTDLYSFFDAPDDEEDGPGDDERDAGEDISFEMF
jgi:hypothetical protein